MAFNAQVLRVMVASPGDVTADRETVVSALHEWNRVNAAARGVILLPWLWETDSVPVMGEHPQTVIDQQGVDTSDIVIALFWSRLGSPTPEAVSGTASEIGRATAAGKFVHVYFSGESHPADVDVPQLQALREFKGHLGPAGLLGEYRSNTLATDINRAIEHDLRKLDDQPALPASPSQTSAPPAAAVHTDTVTVTTVSSDPIQELNLEIEAHGPDSRAVHRRVQEEASRLERLRVLDSSNEAFNSMGYSERLPILETELRTWAGYTALLASWPGTNTDPWWSNVVDRYGTAPALSGDTDAIDSFTAPAIVTLYAGGVAAASQNRIDAVCDLLTGHLVASRRTGQRSPASAVVGAETLYPSNPWPSRRLAAYLGPILATDVGLGTTPVVEAWERFEYIWLLTSWLRLKQDVEYIWFEPYLRVGDDRSAHTHQRTRPLPSIWLTESTKAMGSVRERVFSGDQDKFLEAVRDIDESIAVGVDRSESRDLMRRGGAGWMPTGIRRATIPADATLDPWPPVGSSAGN